MKKQQFEKKSHRWIQTILTLVMISSLLVGCRLPWQAAPETSTKETTPAEIEEAQVPTAEPRRDLPPALVEVTPLPNTYIDLDQSISLYFNQAMDTGSVEAAVHFEPRVSGRFTWEEDQILTFTPDHALTAGSTLHLAVDTSAQAANDKNLQDAIELDFQTAENFMVAHLIPSDLSLDVDPESVVFVTFNQPIVALGAEGEHEPAFTLSPEVPGEGEWLNTSTYVFKSDPSMDGGTMYTLQLNDTLTAASGASLDPSQERQFLFTTTLPNVINTFPLSDQKLRLDGPVEVQFNIRMDPASVEENFSLTGPDGVSVGGEFEWKEDFKSFSFTPSVTLSRITSYTIYLDAGAQSFGGLPIENAVEVVRRTYPNFSNDPVTPSEFQTYYGSYGQYKIHFTTPLDSDDLQDFVTIEPEVNVENLFLSDNDTSINLSGYFNPETTYTVTLDADLRDEWGGRLGEEATFTFSTPPATPSLTIVTGYTSHNLVFVPADISELALQATNINNVTLEISPISTDDLINLLHPDNYDYRQVFLPENIEVTTQNLDLTRNMNEIVTIPLSYQENSLTPGVYFLRISSPDLTDAFSQNNQKFYLIVSENNLVMKISPEQAFVYASQLGDYRPLSDRPVEVYNTDGDIILSGLTNDEGVLMDDIERSDEPYTNFFAIVSEPGESDFAFSISTWGQGYTLYEMGINYNSFPEQTDAYIYTDRPIYRPGDTINFKAALFFRENGLPISTNFETVNVVIYGDAGMSGIPIKLYDEDLVLSQFGTVEGSVTLSEDAPTGMYHIDIGAEEKLIKSLYFDVAVYRKPEIDLSVDLDPSQVIAGEPLMGEVQADYYFGLPASGQTFNYSLYRDDAFFDLPGYTVGPLNTSWLMPRRDGYTPLGTVVVNGRGETDNEGHAQIQFSANELALEDAPKGSILEYNLEMTVIDESGFPVSYRDSTLVHSEEFYIGIQPESYFGRADSAFDFSILTVDWGGEPVGDISLEATFDTIEWVVEETMNPEMPYRYVPQTTPVASADAVTNDEGRARISFTPTEPGTYQLSLESGGAVSQVVVWVSGSGSAIWPRQTQNQISLRADVENYQPGQIAQVFFPNPFPDGAKALVTVERGRVMESQILDIEDAGYTLEVPITSESIPNVYVSVMLLGSNEDGKPDFRQGVLNLPVAPISKTLNVDLLLDPSQTEPGGQVSATLTITDREGNPVQGEFSIAVVDKALLALVEPNSKPIIDAFYGEQPLSVQTSYSLKTYAAQLALSSMELGRGGGGDMMAEATIREDFPDTALWEGEVITGADGTAQLTIPMPDSLTTWVVDVRGLTEDYLVGQTTGEILTQKELMIRPITPSFLVDGDQVEMAAIVHNNTSETLDVDIILREVGFTLMDESEQTQTVTIPSGGSTRVNWWGTVESVELVDLVFQAVSGTIVDASTPVWGDLQVRRYAMPYTFSTAGQLTEEGARLELVSLPISTDPSSGKLTLELTPSLTATLLDGLEALENSPYDDTVTILSRLLANLNAYLALSDLGIDAKQLRSNLLALIEEEIYTLLDAQNIDGGWSWWSRSRSDDSESDVFITAYVLLGLEQAASAGLDVGPHFIESAIEFLSTHILEPGLIESPWMLDRLTFQVYALRNSRLDLQETMDGLFALRSELSPWALGLLALSLQEGGSVSGQMNTLIADLENQAVRSSTGVHWESGQGSWLLPGSNNFNTAVGIFTLAQLDPASTSLPLALRYLMVHRKPDGLWSSTFESAWALMAITEALQGTGDYQADYDFQVTLNDILIAEGAADGLASQTGVRAVTPIDSLHPDAPNALQITRGEGTGSLFYRVDLQTYQPAAEAEAINQGISVQRAYYLAGEGCPGSDDCTPIDSLTLDPNDPSQVITVALTVTLSNNMVNLMLEDFIPAGTEVINKAFLTSQTLPDETSPLFDVRRPFEDGWGWWYFNEPQIYADHVLWTADYVPGGTYTLTYELLPFQRGTYQVLPAHAWQYFYPEVQGTSSGDLFSID